jgi:hypothetical protein
MAASFYDVGSQSTQREPQIMGKQLVNFIICGCELSASFFGLYWSWKTHSLQLTYSRHDIAEKLLNWH